LQVERVSKRASVFSECRHVAGRAARQPTDWQRMRHQPTVNSACPTDWLADQLTGGRSCASCSITNNVDDRTVTSPTPRRFAARTQFLVTDRRQPGPSSQSRLVIPANRNRRRSDRTM